MARPPLLALACALLLVAPAARSQQPPTPPANPPATAPAPTTPPSAPVPAPTPIQPAWDARGAAELQVLDKVTARAVVVVVKVNETVRHGAIAITARACFTRPPNQAPDAAAFLEIADPRRPDTGFRGWMFAANPPQAILEHPIYDVRVLTCR